LACQKDDVNFSAVIAQDAKQFVARDHYTESQYASVLESRMTTAYLRQTMTATDCQSAVSKEKHRIQVRKQSAEQNIWKLEGWIEGWEIKNITLPLLNVLELPIV
jgi:hypothetical protein